jgi:hypothetical protein
MKKFIHALLAAALVLTVSTGTAQAVESPKPKVTEATVYLKPPKDQEVIGYIKPIGSKPKATHLTRYGKRTSLGREARIRLGHGGTSLRLDKHTVVSYIGTAKLKYAGTAKSKPRKGIEQVVVRSSIKKNRFHVYRFNYNAK